MINSGEFAELNDDEMRRIISVIERDFQLREREAKRLDQVKNVIRQEHERVEYLIDSKDFDYSRCIKCFKPFRFLLNPKEICSQCRFYVCHDCATFSQATKVWTCQLCLKLKELESLTADWFYGESGKKYKRCGSAKVVRELYKREKERHENDADGTLRQSPSTDSKDSFNPYVVHDQHLRSELNEYSNRLQVLIENYHADLSQYDQRKVNLNNHQQRITAEISRARMALGSPLRRSNRKLSGYETDLQNLLIQKTEEVLQTSLQEFQKSAITSNFDRKLAELILDKCVEQHLRPKPERQTSIPLTRSNFASLTQELKSGDGNFRRTSFSKTPVVNEEVTENEDEKTPTEEVPDGHNRHFFHTNFSRIQQSTERIADWKMNATLIESKIVPTDDDEQERHTTWF